jgi:CDP-diacylglycerol--serine O-phosphatidyltransferase
VQAGGLEKPFGRVAYPCCGADDYFDDHPVLLLGGEGSASRHLTLLLVIYGLAALMVSNIPFFSLKNNDIKKRHPIWMLVSGFILITLIIAQRQIMFFTIVLLYTLSGPFLWCLTTYKHRRERRREAAHAMP